MEEKNFFEAPAPEMLTRDYEVFEVQVDAALAAELNEFLAPMGLTPERLLTEFFKWFTDPECRKDVIAWFESAKSLFGED